MPGVGLFRDGPTDSRPAITREAKAEQSRLQAALLALRDLCDSI
jgi:hypothetical protein